MSTNNDLLEELATSSRVDYTRVESLTPITQVSAEYGLLNQVLTVSDSAASGSTTTADSKFICQTGVAADGLATILSLRELKYRPGQGAMARLTATFSPGVADNVQAAGLITSENVFAFGCLGAEFGIIYGHDGVSESQELTLTTPAGGAENATVTIDGVGYTVPLTPATLEHNAFQIAESLSSQVPNYFFSSNGVQVVAQAIISAAQGSFLFSSATAAGAWVQVAAGDPGVTEFIPQEDWNIDKKRDLIETNGNVYQVQYQWGFSSINFSVEDSVTGVQVIVHRIQFANTSQNPSATNPTFRAGWISRNTGNTSNVTVTGSDVGVFIEGKIKRSASSRSEDNDQLAIGNTLTNIITFRNRLSFGGKVNRAEIFPLILSMSTQTVKFAFFEILAMPTFAGDLDFSYVDKTNSIMEIATDSVEVTGGVKIGTATVVSGSSTILEFNDRANVDFAALPGQLFCIAAIVPQGSASDCQATGTWQEDL